ncbi:MAG: hypothetical protein E7488_00210 [Ruminococcaceae bacterium]|nr:hypothetical protein [Oscillospiraceae bacterium]
MNKRYWLSVILSVAVMIVLPLSTVKTAPDNVGLIAFIFLLLIINPLYMIFIGYHCGKNIKKYWSLPLVTAVLFWIGAALFLEMSIDGCILYCVVYIIAALISMVTSFYMFHKNPKEKMSVKAKAIKIITFIAVILAFLAFVIVTTATLG